MRTIVAGSVVGMMMVATSVSAQVQYLGWWDTGGDGQNPQPALSQIAEIQGTVNMAMNVWVWDDIGFDAAAAAGQKIVAGWPFYEQLDRGKPITGAMHAWLVQLQRHRHQLAAIYVADEPDCNYRGATFPSGWTVSNCQKAKWQAEENMRVIRLYLPEVPLWINYTSAFANYFTAGNAAGRRLPSADWISFDCYTAWTRCFGTKSVDTLVKGLLKYMAPWQRIALIPQGAVGFKITDPAAVAAVAHQYWAYAQSNPRVVTVAPFIRWSRSSNQGHWIGGRDVWQITQAWANIGHGFIQ